jgi:hypothetical protein
MWLADGYIQLFCFLHSVNLLAQSSEKKITINFPPNLIMYIEIVMLLNIWCVMCAAYSIHIFFAPDVPRYQNACNTHVTVIIVSLVLKLQFYTSYKQFRYLDVLGDIICTFQGLHMLFSFNYFLAVITLNFVI